MVNNLFYGQHQGRANFQHLMGTNKAFPYQKLKFFVCIPGISDVNKLFALVNFDKIEVCC